MYRVVLIVTLLFSQVLFGMSSKDLAIAINLSGKQRMLTQKMSKESFMLFLGIDRQNAKKNLIDSKELFDRTLKGLMYGDKGLKLVATKDKSILSKLKEVEALWEPFKEHIEKIYNYEASDKDYWYIKNNNINLLKRMNEAVFMYAKLNKNDSKFKLANDINLAGRQRMLTQKISKDLLQYILDLDRNASLIDLQNSVKLFDKTLYGLYNGDKEQNLHGTKLTKIVNQLNIVKREWQELKPLIKEQLLPENIDKQDLTLKLLNKLNKTKFEMNKAVLYYTQSLDRQKQVMKLNSIISGFMAKKDSSKHLINLAGKQRMLTQRVSKLSIECAYNLEKGSCLKAEKFISLYQRTLKGFVHGDNELKLKGVKNIESLKQISKLEELLKPFKRAVLEVKNSKRADKKALKYILQNNENLLKESNNLVTIMVKNGSKNVSYIEKAMLKIVNIAGRERMLTQKMTKEYLQSTILGNKDANSKMNKTINLFENSLNNLINGSKSEGMPKVTNLSIKKQLLKVKSIWQKLKPLYFKKLSKKELALLLKVNPILLKEMNKAVYMIDESTDY